MSDIALRPRSSTELVDAAFQLYRREPIQFITGLALVYVPWLVIAALLSSAVRASDLATSILADRTATPSTIALYVLVPAFALLTYALAGGVVSVMAADVYFGRGADLGRAYGAIWRRLPSLLGAMLGFGVLLIVSSILFLLPSLYVYGRWFAIKQVILLEDGDAGDGFGRSSQLTEGHKWHVLNTMGLVLLLNFAISIGVALMITVIPSQIVQLLIRTCVAVVVYPIVGITETLLYYDLRIRREGFDIEYLAAAAPDGVAPGQPAPT